MQDAYYGIRVILFVIFIALVLGVSAFALGQIAPALEKSSQAIVNVQAASQLAQITVTAAQYAQAEQARRDALVVEERRAEIARQAALAAASSQAQIINAQNSWIPYAIGALTLVLSLGAMTVGYIARQRTVTAAINARAGQATTALAVVRETGGAVKLYIDRVEVEVKPQWAPPEERRVLSPPSGVDIEQWIRQRATADA